VTGRRAVLEVARREVVERVRERSFLVSTLVTLLIIAAVVVLPQVLGGDGVQRKVAVASPAGAELAAAAQARAPALDVTIAVRRASPAEAERLVRKGGADAALVGDPVEVLARGGLDTELEAVLQGASAALRGQEALAAEGVGPEAARAALAPPPLPVRTLEGGDGGDEGLAFIATFLLYGQLIGYGFWIAMGIVEEKASRVVEVLLSAVRPRDLLAGKVLGIGVVALAQLLLIGVLSVALALAVGALEVAGDALVPLAVVLGAFLLGYAFYACAFATAGALVPRQEEVQNVTTPLTLLLVASLFLAFAAIDDPGGGLARVATFLPPVAPMVLPVRLIAGEVPAWEVALSVLLLLAATAGLVRVAARVYRNAVLQTGSRIGLRAAWRAAP